MNILVFAASLRTGSYNHKLAGLIARILREAGAAVDFASFREFEMPIYDGDLDAAEGLPAGALALKRRIEAAGAIVIASPEYNYSIGGPLKNAIDWISRARPMPWRGRSIYLVSASPGAIGGIRGLWQARIPLEGCGALVFPDMFALANASGAFTADGGLSDRALADRLRQETIGFLRLAETVGPICSGGDERKQQITRALEDESEIQPSAT